MAEPDPKLMQAAVDDRERRPWRYYKFDTEWLLSRLDDHAARVRYLEARLAAVVTLVRDEAATTPSAVLASLAERGEVVARGEGGRSRSDARGGERD